MVTVILEYSQDCKELAEAKGFREKTILVKFDSGIQSTKENKERLESECRKLQPYQFIVDDYWGMCPD